MLKIEETSGSISIVQPKSSRASPTDQAYRDLQVAYDYFSQRLFSGRLPGCLLTLTRKPKTLGYFSPERFKNIEGATAHEISLNPQHLEARGDYDALSTLVHEQCHLFRHEFGPRNRKGSTGSRGYHDRAWARVMLKVGLVPSVTGAPGGKQTGQSVSHYVEPGGPFDLACRELLISGFTISWHDRVARKAAIDGAVVTRGLDETPAVPTRSKFTCPSCSLNAWAKPSAKFGCLACSMPMLPVTDRMD